MADVKGSTADMLHYAQQHEPQSYIVATEAGILHELQRTCPECTFIPVPPEVTESQSSDEVLSKGSCSCNECQYMKLNTLEKLRDCLRDGKPEVTVDSAIARDAVKPIERMLSMS
jgi:quinolinate synthase